MGSERCITVPLPRPRPPRPGEPRSTQVPIDDGPTEACLVLMPSIHNWVEQVYKAFNQTFPTGANELVLLGVREMSRGGDDAPSEDEYTQLTRTGERGSKQAARTGGVYDSTGRFDDLLFMVWTGSTAEEGTSARVYTCTIDPSRDYSTTTGTPFLVEGRCYRTKPGSHQSINEALHIYTNDYPFIMIAREATKSTRIFRDIESALVAPSDYGPRRWEFVGTEDNYTFHVHWSKDGKTSESLSTSWSAGCTVLGHARGSDKYKEFVRLTKGAANTSEIPYLVVSSAYVTLPDAWITAAAENRTMLENPATTLKPGGLVQAPSPVMGYLSSFMTFDFAQQVLKLAEDVDNISAAVGGEDVPGIDESLANVKNLQEAHSVLPGSVPTPLNKWADSRSGGEALSPEESAGLLEGLSGLSRNLRLSIQRACFQTVAPPENGPR